MLKMSLSFPIQLTDVKEILCYAIVNIEQNIRPLIIETVMFISTKSVSQEEKIVLIRKWLFR